MIYRNKPENFNSKFEVVSCFLEHQGTFLTLLRQDWKPQGNTWGVPAGKVEDNERALDAMLRELEEETGYKANHNELTLSHTLYVRYPDYDFVYHIFALPLGERHEVVVEEKAHKDFEWVTPQQALTKELILDMDTCIKIHYNL